jgi:Gluconate 2-dehydrogenase subunit 3
MNRRELLRNIALLTGGVVIGGEVFLSGCKTGTASADAGFTATNLAYLDEVGETIIPTTTSPGAKAAKIGEFMKTIVTDCYTKAEQDAFANGLAGMDEACKKLNAKGFMECTPEQRKAFLVSLEKEAKAFNEKIETDEKAKREAAKKEMKPFEGSPSHYYTMMKQLTLWGYFTSEVGATKALRHLPVPGKYDGAYAYKKGDKAWSE